MKQFADGVVVITGDALGFGREFTRIGAGLGMRLVLADIQQDVLDATVAEFSVQGVEVIGLCVSVSEAEDVQALADAAIKAFSKANLLSNNIGMGAGSLVWENPERSQDWVSGVDLRGVVYGARILTPLMLKAAKRGPSYKEHIVNTTSMAGLLNAPAMGVYNVSKCVVVTLSESLYQNLSLVTEQIRCSMLRLYFVSTGITQSDHSRPQDLANTTPPIKSQLVSRVMSEKAVSSDKVTAEQVDQMMLDAVRNMGSYIYSHPHALAPAQRCFENIISQRNPSDPFEGKPDMCTRLIDALRG